MDIAAEAARLRAAAEAKPLRLPVNRRIDERHRVRTEDGLSIWFTIQISTNRRITEAVFERDTSRPADGECHAWLRELLPDRVAAEAAGMPDARVRRFELFESLSPGQSGRA